MKQKSLFFPLLLIFSFNASWAIDPNNLIKVVPTTATKCVEYYYYKQELYCSTTAQQAKAVDPNLNKEERQKIVFDERPWSLAWGKVTPAIITIEYVPAGEKIEQWHELITTQFIPNIQDKITLKYYLHSVIDTLKTSGFNPIIQVLHETPDEAMLEFRVTSPENFQQDELQIIRRAKNGYYILHYVIKKADMGTENRNAWLKRLQQSQIR